MLLVELGVEFDEEDGTILPLGGKPGYFWSASSSIFGYIQFIVYTVAE
jgi:hypothetical protein